MLGSLLPAGIKEVLKPGKIPGSVDMEPLITTNRWQVAVWLQQFVAVQFWVIVSESAPKLVVASNVSVAPPQQGVVTSGGRGKGSPQEIVTLVRPRKLGGPGVIVTTRMTLVGAFVQLNTLQNA